MSPLPVNNASISSSYLTQLIQSAMTLESRPLTTLHNQKDEVNITRAVYTDLNTNLEGLYNVVQDLLYSGSTDTSVFQSKKVSVSDKEVLTASASTSAGVGSYNVSVTTLAKAHRVRSEQQVYVDQALGFSGSFVIGGAASRATGSETTVADTVTDFDVAAIASGQEELGSGTYHVEVRDNDGTYQFRVVDADGNGVKVANTTDGASFTSGWQDIDDVAGATFDTGRGLTVDFGSGPYTVGTKGNGAASVSYTAQGHQVDVTSDMTLADIRDAINEGTFADGMEVQATIVDKQLVLTRVDMGSGSNVIASDVSGTVLSGTGANGLGILGDGGAGDVDGGDGFKFTLQQASSATFSVNGIDVTRNSNTGLTDVVDGVTLNLLKASGSTDVTVRSDTDTIVAKFYGLQTQFNKIASYLTTKTAVTKNNDDSYSRGTLSGDTLFDGMRFRLISKLSAAPSGLSANAPRSLEAIGLTFDDNLKLVISDESKLVAALGSNQDGVLELVNSVMQSVSDELEPYVETDGIIDTSISSFDSRLEQIDGQIKNMNERLTDREAALTKQYSALLSQMAYLQNSGQTVLSMMGSGLNLLG